MNKQDFLQNAQLSAFLERVLDLPDFQGVKPRNVNERSILGDTLLHFAARWGDLTAGKILLAGGADPNCHGEYGNTPLHDAVGQRQYEFVKLVLAHGASKEHQNDDGVSPLDLGIGSDDPRLKEIIS